MKKSVKSLAVLLIFLMPLSAFAESWWSPDRIRVNLRVGGSTSEGGLGAINMKYKSDGYTAYGIADGTALATAAAEDKESARVNSGLSIHYIMEMGMLVGIHRYSTAYTTLVTQTGDWTAETISGDLSSGAIPAGAVVTLSGLSSTGSPLAVRKSEGFINFLDVGYFYDLADIVDGMSISGGIGLPLLGSGGSTKLVYGITGYTLNGGLYNESLTADSGSAMSYFVDYGYTFGIHEALLSLRNVSTKSSATVSQTKGLGKVLGKDKFESSGSSMSFFLGYGYIF